MKSPRTDTPRKTIGYLLWVFGFTGAHRFYYGKPVTGVIWFFTLGLLGIHRFDLGKIPTGILWLLTGGLVGIGYLYDYCTLNRQVDERYRGV